MFVTHSAKALYGARRKWQPEITGDIATIPLGNGGVTIIDLADLDLIGWRSWWREDGPNTAYAVTQHIGKHLRMHNIIFPVPAPLLVDHRDRDGLNNRRLNLREGTKGQNGQNRWERNAKSNFKGAAFHRHSGLYHATINVPGRQISLGYFRDPADAARAYDAAAIKHFGQYAVTNASMGAL